MTLSPDLVVLLDPDGTPVGEHERATVHHASTPLHLGFSCYLTDPDGRMLVTRRALVKRTWPGVWTNAFCGHPRPGEPETAAIRRHAQHELGIDLATLDPALPDFRYTATDAGGVVENEICPVWIATTVDPLDLNPDEVMDARWVERSALEEAARATPWAFSPWMVEQLAALPTTALPREPVTTRAS